MSTATRPIQRPVASRPWPGSTRWGLVARVALMIGLAALGLWGPLHQTVQLGGFDAWQRLLPRERLNDGVVVVAIDDSSIAALGQSPWPRAQVARLVEHILAAEPAALGINVFFSEPDRWAPAQLLSELGAEAPAAVRELLAGLPDADARLARAFAAGPVALAVAGLDEAGPSVAGVSQATAFAARGGDPAGFVPAYPGVLASRAALRQAAHGQGATNAPGGPDGALRHLPTLVRLVGDLTPTLPLELLRVASGGGPIGVQLDGGGLRSVESGGRRIPTDRDGRWWLHFSDPEQRPVLSALTVLQDPATAQAVLRGRIALLGYTASGLIDVVQTPRGRMAGVQFLAEALDNAIDDRLLHRPRWAPLAEGVLVVLLVAAAAAVRSWTVPRAVLAGLGATSLLAIGGAAAFAGPALLLDVATPLASGWLALAATQGLSLSETRWQRRQLRLELQASQEAAARSEGELDAARRIQLGMLPQTAALEAREPRVALAAAMQAARQVGGDLYDFFHTDADHLFVVIGDVSGKGVPASLFMALAKVMIRSEALRDASADPRLGAPAAVLSRASRQLALENPECLFVTAFAARLDLRDGHLEWAAAGHDLPYRLGAGDPQRLRAAVGPPLAVTEDDYTYPGHALSLQPGDTLLLYSDGLTDMTSPQGELFGHERLRPCLLGLPAAWPVAQAIERLTAAVNGHAAGAEPADDLALLALRWNGPPAG